MKEPWEVYLESFEHHARRVHFEVPLKEGSQEAAAILQQFAAESAQLLAEERIDHWSPDVA